MFISLIFICVLDSGSVKPQVTCLISQVWRKTKVRGKKRKKKPWSLSNWTRPICMSWTNILFLYRFLFSSLEPAYSCKLCVFFTDWKKACVQHVSTKHGALLGLTGASGSGSGVASSTSSGEIGPASTPSNRGGTLSTPVAGVSSPKQPSASSVHTDPVWKDRMRSNFTDLVISKCSDMTKAAYVNDEDVQVVNRGYLAFYWYCLSRIWERGKKSEWRSLTRLQITLCQCMV